MFQGLVSEIPSGWVLCNGANGTPNLANLFIRGAGGGEAPDDFNGAEVHNHGFTGDSHIHDMGGIGPTDKGTVYNEIMPLEPVVGDTDDTSNLPRYYGLFYIMRL